jgi:signal transduction histidine kinase
VIVEKHQGKLDLQSELGRGTTFVIQLPLHPPE